MKVITYATQEPPSPGTLARNGLLVQSPTPASPPRGRPAISAATSPHVAATRRSASFLYRDSVTTSNGIGLLVHPRRTPATVAASSTVATFSTSCTSGMFHYNPENKRTTHCYEGRVPGHSPPAIIASSQKPRKISWHITSSQFK